MSGQIKYVSGVTASLKLENMFFSKIEYFREEDFQKTDYTIQFNREIKKSEENPQKYRVALEANIKDKNGRMELNIEIVGIFISDYTEQDTDLIKSIIQDNTTAILFPYLRSQISLVTTQPEFSPIILPPMNIVEMFKEK